MKLDYVDPECTAAQETALHQVSGLVAGRAYNAICRMLGGRCPDARLQEEAPEAHAFFMALMTPSRVEAELSIIDAAAGSDGGVASGISRTTGGWIGQP